jgi:hypothetical protein
MNIKITIAAVLAIAGAAAAAPFSVSGTVDFGGPGNAGAPLTVGGGIIGVPASPEYAGPGTTGIAIAPDASGPSMPTLTAGSPGFSFTSFEGGYFMQAPVASGTTPDGFDGVFLMNLTGDFSSVSISSVFVEVSDANGTSNINFTDFGTFGDGGSSNYQLVTYQPDARIVGGAQIWVVFIPSPASAGLLGLAGLAASRRRR